MKKNYVLLSALVIASSMGFSQSLQNGNIPAPLDAVLTSEDASTGEYDTKKNKFNTKVYGDTLFYEDFDGGLPTGWSIVNNVQNNFVWKWDTVYQVGNFSTNTTAIKSTTGSNGFLTLPSDFYNSGGGGGARVEMDTYVESASITSSAGGNFPNAVYITYQQYLRYCCNSGNRLVLLVSTDNFATETEFDMSDDIPINASNTSNAVGGQTNVINISCAVGGASSFKIRILGDGLSAYYWMIDDFAVIEGPANNLTLTTPYLEFNEANYVYYPFYGQIPYNLFSPLPFFGNLINNGSALQTNVELNASVDHLNTPGGGPGTGRVYLTSQLVPNGGTIIAPLCDSVVSVLTGTPRFVPTVLGSFQVGFSVTSDSVDQIPGDEVATKTFATTDTVFARDDNGFGGGTGPASYVDGATRTPGGTAVGDRFATMYILENRNGHSSDNIPTSITYYVTDDVRNIGVEIVPKIWEYDEDSLNVGLDAAFGPEVATSFLSYTVTASDTNSFLTLPFNTGSALTGNGLDSGQYAVGWEVTNLPTGTTFEVANDATTAADQVPVSTFLYLAHAPAAGWGWVAVNPVIRLNMGNLRTVGVASNQVYSAQFEVSPNPSNGEFKLNITTEQSTAFNLNVRNMLGQTVYTGMLRVNGPTTERLDLSGLEKGVYFVTLENENEKLLKKVVLK